MRADRAWLPSAVAVGAVACAALATGTDMSPSSRPPHHTATGFTNPGHGVHSPPSLGITLPFFWRRALGSFSPPTELAAERVGNDGSLVRARTADDAPTVTWVGHSTLLVQLAGTTFLTDPIWSRVASPLPVGPERLVEPGVAIDDLPPIDFVLVSHNHYDHMDLPTLSRLAERGTRFFVPLANAKPLAARDIGPIRELDWWQSETVGDITIHCVPARHWSRRGLFDMNDSLWAGWVVAGGGRRFYFAGDTGAFDGFAAIKRRLGPIDLAAIPIGAYLPSEMMAPAHLNPEEAIDAAVALDARRSLAVHFGTFVLSDEPFDEPPRRFADASRRAGRGPDTDWVFKIGETRSW